MMTRPIEIRVTDDRRQDLLANVACERRTAGVCGPALQVRPLAIRVVTLVALCLGVRG